MPEDNGNKVTKPQFLHIIYLLAFVLLLVWAINAIITYTKLSSNQSFLGRLTSSVLLQKPLTQDNVKYVRLQGPQGAPGSQGKIGLTGPQGAPGPQGKIGLTGPSGTSGCINSQCLSLQPLTPGVQEAGNINISGSVLANTIIATTIQGDGSGLTNVNANKLNGNDSSYYTNASNLTTGTIANNLLSNTVTEQGNNFNSPNQLLQLNSSGGLPAISGANLTDLNASNISTGTLADNLLSADVPLLNSNNLFQPSIDSANTLNINTTTGSTILNVNTNPYTVTNNSGIPPWTTSSSTLPQGLIGATSVTYNGYVYVMGGGSNAVYYAPLNYNGSVGSWTISSNTLPQALHEATSVTYNGYVYVMGGATGSSSATATNTVYYAPLNSNGSVGSWTTSASTLPQALYGATSVIYNGYVYVMGGSNNSGGYLNTVYYAPLNSNGLVGSWTASTSTLPQALGGATSVTYNGYVYVMGGYNGYLQKTVYYAPLNSNGSVGSWTISSNTLPQTLMFATSVTYNGYVYVMGGNYNTIDDQNNVSYAPLNSNGSVGSWAPSTSTLPYGVQSATSVIYNGYVYVMGGYDFEGSGNSNAVYYTLLPGPITIGQGSINANGILVATNNTYLQALTANGAVLLQDSTNSTSAFQVQNSLGNTVLAVNTVNNRVGIGTTSPNYPLDVVGNINTSSNYLINGVQISSSNLSDSANIARLNANQTFSGVDTFSNVLTLGKELILDGHYVTGNTSGNTTITAGSAAGTSPTVSINGNDVGGTITITTGSSGVSSGTIVNVVFANAYGATPSVVISSDNAATAILENYVSGISTTGFSIDIANTTVASTTYVYSYFVTQ